jgi:RNA polymerase sigma-70 factor (ECF subfamily)
MDSTDVLDPKTDLSVRRGTGAAPMPLDCEEDQQVERARNGDPGAIDWLIDRYRARAVRLAAHVLRDQGDAEDVAQEAFVRVFRGLDAYRSNGSFYTWLYRIVIRICLDRRRLSRWDREIALSRANSLATESPDIQNVISRIVVEQLLDRLAPPVRAMLVLRELEGLEYQEIAEVLGIPIGRVRWRLHDARAKFQELWAAACQEESHVR